MAFWGIEVKPGKPYTHRYDESRGRLHVSQATLGNGKGTAKSVLQCNVGSRSPILLCSLFPDQSETCHLELEFEEDDDVVFAVLGPRGVHLSGFFLGSSGGRGYGDDDIETCGEDIGEEDSYDSYGSDEDDYESDFIDDSSVEMFPPSPPKSSVVIEEIVEDDKPVNGFVNHRRLKKKYLLSDTDDGDNDSQLNVEPNTSTVLESEDEDGFPISVSLKSKGTVEGKTKASAKILDEDRKRKMSDIREHAASAREDCQPCDSSLPLVDGAENSGVSRKKKKVKGGKPLEDLAKASVEKTAIEPHQGINDKAVRKRAEEKDLVSGVEVDLIAEQEEKLKKKKKKKSKESAKRVEVSETEIFCSEIKEEAAKTDTNEVTNTGAMNQDNPSEAEKLLDSKEDSSGKSRKNKKKNRSKVVKDENNQDRACSSMEMLVKDVQEGNQQSSEDMLKINDAHLQKSSKDNGVIDEDLSTMKLSKEKFSDENGHESKKKKKRSKNQEKDLNTDNKSLNLLEGEQNIGPRKSRNFSNGLTVEELSMGKPDGKKASPGSKVSVNYIGKLQDGKVFDSNVGKRSFKFLLGVGQVIKGWDVGIKGMRVGDKRRLTIPPSMGYGEKNLSDIPANSWLVFDVELVDVQ